MHSSFFSRSSLSLGLAGLAALAVGCAVPAGPGDERLEGTAQATSALSAPNAAGADDAGDAQAPALASATGPADPNEPATDCINTAVPIPRGLAGESCTLGVEYYPPVEASASFPRPALLPASPFGGSSYVVLAYAFACPAGVVPPSTLGGLLDDQEKEVVTVEPGGIDNPCFGNPEPGWEIVSVAIWHVPSPLSPVGCPAAVCDAPGSFPGLTF